MDAPALPLPELWRLRTPSSLVRGVALLKDVGAAGGGVKSVAEIRGPGIAPVDGLAEILFPTGLPSRAMSFSTVMTDSFTHRTYVGVQISKQNEHGDSPDGLSKPTLATCAWSELPEVAAPHFLKLMEAVQQHPKCAQIWAWLVNDVPAPPPGTALVLHGITVSGLCAASRVAPACLPAVHVPLQHLLTRLSVSSVVLLTRLLLLEQKVLFVGSSVALLTSACEAFSSILLFPLAWVHCYNPLLPSTDYLATPPPFLFGCLREIILKETFADSNDLATSELLAPLSQRDFTIFDLDTGDVYVAFSHGEDHLPDLPDAAQSRLRFSFTELRSQLEAQHDVWQQIPGRSTGFTEPENFGDAVQKIYLTFMADLLGDVAGSLGPQCDTATAASVLSSFQEGHFLSGVSAKDKPFFEALMQTNAFLAYLQTLHLFGTSESPFAEALRSLGHKRSASRLPLPPPRPREGAVSPSAMVVLKPGAPAAPSGAMDTASGAASAPLQLHLCFPSSHMELEIVLSKAGKERPEEILAFSKCTWAAVHGTKVETASGSDKTHRSASESSELCGSDLILGFRKAAEEERENYTGSWEKLLSDLYKVDNADKIETPEHRWSLLLLYAALSRKMGASKEFLLKAHLAIDRPAAVPTHRMLELMNGIEPHSLSDLLSEADEQSKCLRHVSHIEESESSRKGNASARFARRLLAISNPSALASAEAARDPLAALAFVCPDEENTPVEPPLYEVEKVAAPRVELLPFKGPKETSVLNHRRFCSWTDRSPEVLSAQLVRDVYRACVAAEKGSSKAFKLLERLSEPLAELQCCSLQGKNHDVRLSFWLNCLNAATLLAALAPARIGIPERPSQASDWAELIRTAQLEVQGELVSLADMEEIIRSQNEVSTQDPILKDDEGREGRVSYGRYDEGRDEGATNRGDQSGQPSSAVLRSFHLKRPVPLASFAIHRPTARGFPPLRVFQAKHLQAQLELNAAQFLATEMQLDFWRKKVTLPESLRWHLADFGGEANLLEKFSSLLKHAPEQAELLKETLPELPNLGDRPDRLRIEYQEVQWTFQISSAPFQANFTSKRDFFVLSNFLSDFQSVFRTVKL